MANDTRGKFIINIDQSDIDRAERSIREKFEGIGKSGEESGRKIQEAFANIGKQARQAVEEGFPRGGIQGLDDIKNSIILQRRAVEGLQEQYKKAKAEFDNLNIGTNKLRRAKGM